MDTPTQDSQFNPHATGSTWTAASSLSDLDKLVAAFNERAGGGAEASLRDVFHIAQRRHGFRRTYQDAATLMQQSGRYSVDSLNPDRPSMVKKVG